MWHKAYEWNYQWDSNSLVKVCLSSVIIITPHPTIVDLVIKTVSTLFVLDQLFFLFFVRDTNLFKRYALGSLPWCIIALNGLFIYIWRGCPRGVKAMDCGIVVCEFVLQSNYYVHFRANTLGKGMNPLLSPSYSTTTVLLGTMALALNNLQRLTCH